MKNWYVLLLAGSSGLFAGCVNLQRVNTFSTSAIASLDQRSRLPATFTEVYRQRVENDSLDRHPFRQIPLVGIDFPNQLRTDSLRSYQQADSLGRAGVTLLIAYFQAIADLSASGQRFVPVQLKSATFDSFLQGSAVRLTSDQTASFNRVANLLASSATGAYRRRKLATLLDQSHDDVRTVLDVLMFTFRRLADVVAISREQQYVSYKNRLLQETTLGYGQKRDLAQQWILTSRRIEQTRQNVLTYVTLLQTVQTGYNELYQQRRQLNSPALWSALATYASTLKQLRLDLEQLTPVYGRLNP